MFTLREFSATKKIYDSFMNLISHVTNRKNASDGVRRALWGQKI